MTSWSLVQPERSLFIHSFIIYLFIFSPLTALIGSGATELFLAQLWVWGSLQTRQGDGSCNDL